MVAGVVAGSRLDAVCRLLVARMKLSGLQVVRRQTELSHWLAASTVRLVVLDIGLLASDAGELPVPGGLPSDCELVWFGAASALPGGAPPWGRVVREDELVDLICSYLLQQAEG